VQDLRESFYAAYRERYSRYRTDVQVESLTWRVVASGPTPAVRLRGASREAADAIKGARDAYFSELGAFTRCTVYDRYALAAGTRIEGPAIIEERESTIVVGPSGTVAVDDHLNVLIEVAYDHR
jgi:N-methylhydantoinase A